MFGHGYGCSQEMWRLVARDFERDHRVILFDHVGSGRSELTAYDPRTYSSLARYAADVIEILDAIGSREVVFVGHSASATIGVLAANQAPARFAGLVLVTPSPRFVDDPPDYQGGFTEADLRELLALVEKNDLGWATRLAATLGGAAGSPVTQELEASFCAMDHRVAPRFAEASFFSDHRADFRRVEHRSLVVQCRHDPIVPTSVGRWLHGTIADSAYEELDVRGHTPHLSHPAETIAAIRGWLGPTTVTPS